MRSVGIDIGIRNYGVAIIDGNKDVCNIISLELIDLCTFETTEAIIKLQSELERIKNEYIQDSENTIVGIEQQPEHQHVNSFSRFKRDNTQMKSIAHATQMFFLANKIPVKFVSPKSKWKVYDGPPLELTTKSKNPYIQNKHRGIQECLAIMTKNLEQKWIAYIKSLTKKDDVCDAYLLAYYCLTKLT